MRKKIEAYAYLRVSGEGQENGHGFERQLETITGWAAMHHYVIAGTFRDTRTGNTQTRTGTEFDAATLTARIEAGDRPEFLQMLAEMLANGVRTVLIESCDRLARNVGVQSLLVGALRERKITLISCLTGEDVTAAFNDDPMRTAMIQMQTVFSELEKRLLVVKLRRAREAKRKKTGRCEGRKPYGFRPGERKTIELMRFLRRRRGGKRVGKHLSFGKIAAELNQRKIPTRTGVPWHMGTVKNILKAQK